MGCCSALNCSNSSEKNFRMFRFPSNPERRKKWIENCRREGWVPGPNAQLCSAHFDENQYEKHRQDGFKKLTPCAVPTIFPEKNSNTVKTVMTIKIEPPEEDDIVFPNLDFTTDNLLTPKTEPPDEEGAVKSCKVEAASPEVNQETPSPLTTSSKHELITKGNHLEEKLCSKESIQNGISFSSSPWILIPKLSLFPVLGESKLMTSDSLNKSSQLPISQQESCSKTNDSNFSNNSLSSRPILKPVVPVRKSSRIAQKKTKFKDLFKRSNLPITLLPEYGKKEVDAKRPQQMPPDIIESKRPRFTTWRKLVPIMPKITVTEELPQKEGYILAKTGTTNSDPKVEKKVVKAVNLFGSESIPKETKKDSTKEDAKSPPVSMDLGKGDETGNKMAASETGSISEAETMEPSIVGDCLAYKPGHTAVLGIPGIVESMPYASITHLSPSYTFQMLDSSRELVPPNTQILDSSITQPLDLPSTETLDLPTAEVILHLPTLDLPCTQMANLPKTLNLPYTQTQPSTLKIDKDSPQESPCVETILPPPPEFADNAHRFQNVDGPPPCIPTQKRTRIRNILTKNSYRQRMLESQAEANKMAKFSLKARNRTNAALERFTEAQKSISQDFNKFVKFFIEE